MNLLFLLKQHFPDLAALEAKACVRRWGFWESKARVVEGTLYVQGVQRVPRDLGLTRRIVQVLLSCKRSDLERELSRTNWERILKNSTYKVELTRQAPYAKTERELAHIIWDAQEKPRVAMKSPQIIVDIIVTKSTAYVGIRAWEEHENFEDRRAHRWPAPHPSALHPAIARAIVHLACSKRIDDPCCGAGGLLLEAGLVGIRVSGGDIEEEMIARAARNLAHYGVAARLRVADATNKVPPMTIVTDLPFGKSTRATPGLAAAILARAKHKVVLGMHGPLRVPPGWRSRAHISLYVHKGLTRHFYVLERG